MYKRDEHYNSKINKGLLYKELDTYYSAETDLVSNMMSCAITEDLVSNMMSCAITEGLVETRHELAVANEELWSLNDWPEDHGFGSSDRAEYLRRIKETIAFERKFLQAEQELITINRLTECPKNDTVRAYMKMNEKLAEGMVA